MSPGNPKLEEARKSETRNNKSGAQDDVAVPELLHRQVKNERDLSSRVDALKTEVVGANWGDYLTVVMDVPFWEEELRVIEHEAQPFGDTSAVSVYAFFFSGTD